MFGGKGGVGKTTCTAATALHQSRSGSNTLVISTDATPSLAHIFDCERKEGICDVEPRLHFVEIGESEIRQMWNRRFGREVYEVFSSFVSIQYEDFTEFMTSVLPGLGDEFMIDYIRELSILGKYDTIVWDSAPMGQTLALLRTPELLSKHLRMAPRVYSRLKLTERSKEPVIKILKRWEELARDNVNFLKKGVDLTLVTIAEALAVEQLEGIMADLGSVGMRVSKVIVNNVVKDDGSSFFSSRAGLQKVYLDRIKAHSDSIPVIEVPMFALEVKGVDQLDSVARVLFPQP